MIFMNINQEPIEMSSSNIYQDIADDMICPYYVIFISYFYFLT